MKFSRFRIIAILITAAALLASCGSRNADVSQQEEVAKGAFDALRNTDWAKYTTFLTQDALEAFQAQIINGMGAIVPRDSAGNPADSFQIMGKTFNTQNLFTMSADSFMIEILGQLFETTPQLKQTFSTIQNDILGGIMEGDTFTHLVIRNEYSFNGEQIEEMSVTTLRLADGGWKLTLGHQVRGIADMMVQGMQAQASQARMRQQLQSLPADQGNR